MERKKILPLTMLTQITFKSESEGTKPEAADCISTPLRKGPLDMTLVKAV